MTPRPSGPRASVLVGALAAALYLVLASAAPRWGDPVDLARRAVLEPIAPYGRSYPLQSALVRLADAAIGDPARAATVVTALLGGLGVGLAHRLASGLGCRPTAALATAAVWAFHHTCWTAAVDGEAYVLLGVQALAACGVVLAAREGPRVAWLAGLLVGSMPLHHRAALFVAPVVVLAPVVMAPAGRRRGAAGRVVLGGLAGLLPFALVVWAETGRLEAGADGGFWATVLVGTPRNAELFLASERPLLESLAYVGRWTLFAFGGVAVPLAVVGLTKLARRRTREALLLLALGGLGLLLPLRFDAVGDRHVFLVVPACVLLLGVAAGLDAVADARPRLAVGLALACAAAPPAAFAGLAGTAGGRALLPGLRPDAARDFLLPVRTADPGSAAWCLEIGRAMRSGEPVYAEWGAAAALEYARDVAATVPPVPILRRPPTLGELRAAPDGVLFAVTPIWTDERTRLPPVAARAEPVAPSLYRLHPPE